MDESTLWWVIAGILVAVELATGSFYLLMLALGCVAGALAAHAGLGTALQIAATAIVGGMSAGALYVRRRKTLAQAAGNPMGTQNDPDLSLDLGQTVHVALWQPDGSALVQYRGASWAARLNTPQPASAGLPEPGTYRIIGMQGNQLLLDKT